MNKIDFSYSEALKIVELYKKEEKTIKDISLIFNVSKTPIKRILKREGVFIPNKRSQRKYDLNESYFEEINSFDSSYCFGFLMADGYNNENRGVIELSSAQDVSILEDINVCLGSNKPIRKIKQGEYESYRISWNSKKLSEDLKRLGCMQAKTHCIKFPNIEERYMSSFIRGYFDGDGCISWGYTPKSNYFGNTIWSSVSITGTEDFCIRLASLLKERLDINSYLYTRHKERDNIKTLGISGNNQIMAFERWIYGDGNLFLERKKIKFKELFEKVEERKKLLKRK